MSEQLFDQDGNAGLTFDASEIPGLSAYEEIGGTPMSQEQPQAAGDTVHTDARRTRARFPAQPDYTLTGPDNRTEEEKRVFREGLDEAKKKLAEILGKTAAQ